MKRRTTPIAAILALCAMALLAPATNAASGLPTIVSTSVSAVHTESSTLEAQINPNELVTGYHFEYGLVDCATGPCTSIPAKDASIAKGSAPVPVSAAIEGLSPATIYHFRVVAKNSAGPAVKGPDTTFATFELSPIFGACPNDALRLENPAALVIDYSSAGLPDCRAYEQASPIAKNGVDALGGPTHSRASSTGDAVSFVTSTGVPGGEGSQDFPSYLASRGIDGPWSSQGLLPPASLGQNVRIIGWTPDFSEVFEVVSQFGNPDATLLMRTKAGGALRTVVPHGLGLGGSRSAKEPKFAGTASNGAEVFFETKAALVPGAVASKSNVYVWDRESDALKLAGALNDGKSPKLGSIAGAYDWMGLQAGTAGALTSGGGWAGHYLRDQHAVSSSGDVYFTAAGTGELYLRRNPTAAQSAVNGQDECIEAAKACTVLVSKSHRTPPDPLGPAPAAFMAASTDGSKAFFTSSEELTQNANTGPEPAITPPPSIGRADLADGGNPDPELIVPQSTSDLDLDGKYVYWSDPTTNSIGRAELNGDNPQPKFITGASDPEGVAVDSEFIYWANEGTDTIGRAEIGGGNPKQDFITGADHPKGIDVDSTYVYWVNRGSPSSNSTIGRAELGGGKVEQSFCDGSMTEDVAVNSTHIYYSFRSGFVGVVRRVSLDCKGASGVMSLAESNPETAPRMALDGTYFYWADAPGGTLHRVTLAAVDQAILENKSLNGSDPQTVLVAGAGTPRALAVDGANVYWSSRPADPGDPRIGRGDIADGANPQPAVVPDAHAAGIAVDSKYVYWADPVTDTIGRAELDGNEPEYSFITGADNPQGVAVDAEHLYWTNAATGTVADPNLPRVADGAIGRADLDGSGDLVTGSVKQNFISEANNPGGIAVNGEHIYWANRGEQGGGSAPENTKAIGRADLDGGKADQAFIPYVDFPHIPNGLGAPNGIAVDGAHLYWSSTMNENQEGRQFVIRRDLDGGAGSEVRLSVGVVQREIVSQGPALDLAQLAIDAGHVYWADPATESIGRANLDLDPASVDRSFAPGVPSAHGVAAGASHVYWSSMPPPVPASPGKDLYRFDAESGELTDLTPDPSAEFGAEAKGVLGTSEDGSWVYFVANGVLAPGAEAGNCKATKYGSGRLQDSGQCSLYLAHAGSIEFIARLDVGNQEKSDAYNWTPQGFDLTNDGSERTARMSADGTTLLFRSQRQLTPYDNHGIPMLYLYRHGGSPAIVCLSCNPTGGSSQGLGYAASLTFLTPDTPASTLTRTLSPDGRRVFFVSKDALVGADTNGDGGCPLIGYITGHGFYFPACQDVYEWEEQGKGSCTTATYAGGCIYLLSSGKSPVPSFFIDASASGDDAFIITRERLVGQDQDSLYDVYDARVGGGLASQNQPAQPPLCEGEGCLPSAASPPQGQSAGSAGFSGPGDPPVKRQKPPCQKARKAKKPRRCHAKQKKNHRKHGQSRRAAR
jgi:sugar lactone lactonase YvrE